MNHYPYGWSFNLSIGGKFWLSVVVWIGDKSYRWEIRQPLKIHKGIFRGVYSEENHE